MENDSKSTKLNNARTGMTRSEFIGRGLAAATAFTIVPAHVLSGHGGKSPSDKLNIAGIGVADRGAQDLANMESENIVALCDVNKKFAAPIFKKYSDANVWTDYRKMLEKQKDIDAIMVATPDHLHTVVTKTAMELGKHVYTEKPLTRTIEEGRILLETARKTDALTQMGNQGHSSDATRRVREYIEDGAIGPVREVHCWAYGKAGMWPQGIGRPTTSSSIPSYLDWDLWLGPAPFRPYHQVYQPNRWRGWWDFGNGSLGDMACHVMDPAYYALQLGSPKNIAATYTQLGSRGGAYKAGIGFDLNMEINGDDFPVQGSCSGPDAETYPLSAIIKYEFEARGKQPPVTMKWWDCGLKPPMIRDMKDLPEREAGSLLVGDKGIIACSSHGYDMKLYPERLRKSYQPPPKKYRRRTSKNHQQEWINACKGGRPPSSNFEYAAPLSEIVLLGALALRTGERIEWNDEQMKASNVPEADRYIKTNYRKGWHL